LSTPTAIPKQAVPKQAATGVPAPSPVKAAPAKQPHSSIPALAPASSIPTFAPTTTTAPSEPQRQLQVVSNQAAPPSGAQKMPPVALPKFSTVPVFTPNPEPVAPVAVTPVPAETQSSTLPSPVRHFSSCHKMVHIKLLTTCY
jgi:DNA polymerase-3 subunit gamma/tau